MGPRGAAAKRTPSGCCAHRIRESGSDACASWSSLARADELGQLRRDLVQVADDAEVGEVEDRRVRDPCSPRRSRPSSACRPCAGSRPRCRARCRASATPTCRSGRPAPSTGTSRRRRRRGWPRLRRRARPRAPRRRRSPRARRARARRRRSRPRPRSTARSTPRTGARPARRAWRSPRTTPSTLSTDAEPPRLDRVERARADEREPRRARPAAVDEHRVAERRAPRHELAALDVRGRSRPS